MGVVANQQVVSVGNASTLVLAANPVRKRLVVVNKDGTNTLKYKFGSPINPADVTEVQKIAFSAVPTAGNFKLQWNGILTANIAFGAVAADVQTALRAVTGLSSVTVTGDFTSGFVVTMTGATPSLTPDLPMLVAPAVNNTLVATATPVVITITEQTKGVYADGITIGTNASVTIEGEACPIDALYLMSSTGFVRAELIEG